MKTQQLSLIILALLLLFQNTSCVRSYMIKSATTAIHVERVNIMAVAYHRPDYDPAEHDDFKLKNKEINCMSSDELWKDLIQDDVKVRECVNSISEGAATYFYVPATQPYLELDQEEESNPKCLKTTLAKIPLPREIYYLGQQFKNTLDEEQLDCFSSSFSTKTNQLMMTPTGFLKKKIVIPFPLVRELKNAKDVSLWLMVTTFTILKSDDQADGKLLATPVTDSLCRACFKHDALFEEKFSHRLKPVFWP